MKISIWLDIGRAARGNPEVFIAPLPPSPMALWYTLIKTIKFLKSSILVCMKLRLIHKKETTMRCQFLYQYNLHLASSRGNLDVEHFFPWILCLYDEISGAKNSRKCVFLARVAKALNLVFFPSFSQNFYISLVFQACSSRHIRKTLWSSYFKILNL